MVVSTWGASLRPYERKIIHSRLQENSKVFTHSIGEEPNRRLVVSLKFSFSTIFPYFIVYPFISLLLVTNILSNIKKWC